MAVVKKQQAGVMKFETETIFAITQKGKAKWCMYLTPDQYGKFSTDLYLSQKDTDDLIKQLEDLRESAYNEVVKADKKINGVNDVYKEKDGKIYFQFKVDADKAKKITIVDVSGQEDKNFDKLIGNGSLIKVKYMAKPYYMNSTKMVGVSLRLLAIQVLKLEEFNVNNGGFTDERENIQGSSQVQRPEASFANESANAFDDDEVDF